MNSDRIKEIQKGTAYPDSVSVQQALLQVWYECEQQPSEGEINAIAQKVAEESGGVYYGDYYKAAKLAIKELLNPKR